MSIQEYFKDWSSILDLTIADKIAKDALLSGMKPKEIFHVFRICPYNSLKVVVLTDSINDFQAESLDILKEAVTDFTVPHDNANFEIGLEKWNRQGILTLTASQTEDSQLSELWRDFLHSFFMSLSSTHTGIVYLLLGEQSWKFKNSINSKFNYVLRENSPSWYTEEKRRMPSFIWTETKDILMRNNGYEIQWQ